MAKLTLNNVLSGFLSLVGYNTNNDLIEAALENTLSRDGTSPNQMGANLDMNSNRVINLAEPINANEAARLIDVQNAIAGNSTANLIGFTPYGNIASTTVQGAIQEEVDDLGASSGSSLVGFIQNGISAVSRTSQSKQRDIINVRDFGAVGDGITDDYPAIAAAIAYAVTLGGGIVQFPEGTFRITSTINILDSGITLIGIGEGHYYGTVSSVTLDSPVTEILYDGIANPVIHFNCRAGEYKKYGGGVEKIFINCGTGVGIATYGILITSRDKLTIRNVFIFNAISAQIKTRCYSGTLASALSGYDTQHCLFENVIASIDNSNLTGAGLLMTGGQGNGGIGQGNTSFCTLINTRWPGASGSPAVMFQDVDNIVAVQLRCNGGGVAGALVFGCAEDDESGGLSVARYVNIYGCEASAGVIAKASQVGNGSSHDNAIYGYNISNGGTAPTIQTGAGGASNAELWLHGAWYYTPNQIILPTGGLIDFTQTSNSLADSRTVSYTKLGLVEEGTLTAGTVLVQGTTSAGTQTASVNTGYYTRIGSLVFVVMQITWSAHTGTGNIRVSGLPFTAKNTNRPAVLNISASSLTYTAGATLVGHVEQNAKTLLVNEVANGVALAGVALDTAATLYISGCYVAE